MAKLFSIRGAAAQLGISEAGLRRLVKTGQVTPDAAGGNSLLFTPESIERIKQFLNERESH